MYPPCSQFPQRVKQFVRKVIDEDDVGMMGYENAEGVCVMGPDRVITLACSLLCFWLRRAGRCHQELPGLRKQPASGMCAIAVIL